MNDRAKRAVGRGAGVVSVICAFSPLLVLLASLVPPLDSVYEEPSGTGLAAAGLFFSGVAVGSLIGTVSALLAITLLRSAGVAWGWAAIGGVVNGLLLAIFGWFFVHYFLG